MELNVVNENKTEILTDLVSSTIGIETLPVKAKENVLSLLADETKDMHEELICNSITRVSLIIIDIKKKDDVGAKDTIVLLGDLIAKSIDQVGELKKLIYENYLDPEKYLESYAKQLKAICNTFNNYERDIDLNKFRELLKYEFSSLDDEYTISKKKIEKVINACTPVKYTYSGFKNGLRSCFFILKGLWSMKYYLWILGRILYSTTTLVIIPGDLEFSLAGLLRIAGAVCIAFATDPILLGRAQRMIIDLFGKITFFLFTFPLRPFIDFDKMLNTRLANIFYYIAHYFMLSSTTFLKNILSYVCVIITSVYPTWTSGQTILNKVASDIMNTANDIIVAGANGLFVLLNFIYHLPSNTFNYIYNTFSQSSTILSDAWYAISCHGIKFIGGKCDKDFVPPDLFNLFDRVKTAVSRTFVEQPSQLVTTKDITPTYENYREFAIAMLKDEKALTTQNLSNLPQFLVSAFNQLTPKESSALLIELQQFVDPKHSSEFIEAVTVSGVSAAYVNVVQKLEGTAEKIKETIEGDIFENALKTTKFDTLYKEAKTIGEKDSLLTQDIVGYLYILSILGIIFSFYFPIFG